MRPVLAAFVVTLAACSGDTPPQIDANPLGPRCSKQIYDLCAEEHDCTSMVCQNFASDMLQVCTQGCAPGVPCPKDRNGVVGACEGGACKPTIANMCHL